MEPIDPFHNPSTDPVPCEAPQDEPTIPTDPLDEPNSDDL